MATDPASERYLALGDSFTIGTGTTPERSFPAVLVDRWKKAGRAVELTNPAVNGFTTDDLIARELPLAATVKPTFVTVLIGSNDIVRGRSADQYRAQLQRIHSALGAAGIPAGGLVALPQPDWSISPAAAPFGTPAELRAKIEAFNQIAREEVERAGGRYIDLFPLMRRQADAKQLASDGLHPSAAAYAEWAAMLEELLATPAR
ncbi:MAG TPA: SGNH/GDSL hydrolase family protein [Candidatus Saccharimonadales bacterium]|nr:SGNH/GDSL hydrolase family protein [Candidatus Saccharimonadales bacterium]